MRKKSSAILLFLSIYSQGTFANEIINKNESTPPPKEKTTPLNSDNFINTVVINNDNTVTIRKEYISHFDMVKNEEEKRIISDRYISSSINNNDTTFYITEEISENLEKHLKAKHPGYTSDFNPHFAYIIPSKDKAIKEEIYQYLRYVIYDNSLINHINPLALKMFEEQTIDTLYVKIKSNNHLLSEVKNNKTQPLTDDEKKKLDSRINRRIDHIIHHSVTKNAENIQENRDVINNSITKKINSLNEAEALNTENIDKNKTDININTGNINRNKNNIDRIDSLTAEYFSEFGILDSERKDIKGHFQRLYIESSVNRGNINHLSNDLKHLSNDLKYFKSETNTRFSKVEKRANQGIASVAAISNLPFTDSATFSTAIGIGNYRNATALAWGMQYRINENVKVRASTAWNDSNNFVSAGGVGISW